MTFDQYSKKAVFAINTVYPAFNGEVNQSGIGSPTVFVRLQGCHIRCYLKTIGVTCDTPKALEMPRTQKNDPNPEGYEWLDIKQLYDRVSQYNIKRITLTGGDPLARKKRDLEAFFNVFTKAGYEINVETSGTLPWGDLKVQFPEVGFVADYKTKSAGIDMPSVVPKQLPYMDKRDWVKFVIHDDFDYKELVKFVEEYDCSNTNVAAGIYWKGKLGAFDLFDRLLRDGLLDKVHCNFQVHQLAQMYDSNVFNSGIREDI